MTINFHKFIYSNRQVSPLVGAGGGFKLENKLEW